MLGIVIAISSFLISLIIYFAPQSPSLVKLVVMMDRYIPKSSNIQLYSLVPSAGTKSLLRNWFPKLEKINKEQNHSFMKK